MLLDDGADMNGRDCEGYTALSNAVVHAKQNVVELLLERNADVDKEDDNQNTPLIHAINWTCRNR